MLSERYADHFQVHNSKNLFEGLAIEFSRSFAISDKPAEHYIIANYRNPTMSTTTM